MHTNIYIHTYILTYMHTNIHSNKQTHTAVGKPRPNPYANHLRDERMRRMREEIDEEEEETGTRCFERIPSQSNFNFTSQSFNKRSVL